MDKPRICKFSDDYEEDFPTLSGGLYSNLTVVSTSRSAYSDKSVWHAVEEPALSSSGTFGRLLRSTACRKPDKYRYGVQEAHKVELNLHQFQSESGDSLGEDPDSWARLTF